MAPAEEQAGPEVDASGSESLPWDEALELSVDESVAGQRVDAAVSGLADVSRAQVQRWIEAGRVRVEGEDARIEAYPQQFDLVFKHSREIVGKLPFRRVTLDLRGYS